MIIPYRYELEDSLVLRHVPFVRECSFECIVENIQAFSSNIQNRMVILETIFVLYMYL